MKIRFKRWECELRFAKYKKGGRNAIELIDAEDGEPVLIASVNLLDEPMKEDEVAIKDYSENEGILRCLVRAEVVSEPVRIVQSGFVSIPICKLLIKQ